MGSSFSWFLVLWFLLCFFFGSGGETHSMRLYCSGNDLYAFCAIRFKYFLFWSGLFVASLKAESPAIHYNTKCYEGRPQG